MDFTVPEFDIERNRDRCTLCGACVKECSYKVHFFSKDKKAVLADERKCVACHRCAVICPSHAIKIVNTIWRIATTLTGLRRRRKKL